MCIANNPRLRMKSLHYRVVEFGTTQSYISLSFTSDTKISNSEISGIHTRKLAVPVNVSYLTRIVALDEPRISDPSTYTELHDDVTYSIKTKKEDVKTFLLRLETKNDPARINYLLLERCHLLSGRLIVVLCLQFCPTD